MQPRIRQSPYIPRKRGRFLEAKLPTQFTSWSVINMNSTAGVKSKIIAMDSFPAWLPDAALPPVQPIFFSFLMSFCKNGRIQETSRKQFLHSGLIHFSRYNFKSHKDHCRNQHNQQIYFLCKKACGKNKYNVRNYKGNNSRRFLFNHTAHWKSYGLKYKNQLFYFKNKVKKGLFWKSTGKVYVFNY